MIVYRTVDDSMRKQGFIFTIEFNPNRKQYLTEKAMKELRNMIDVALIIEEDRVADCCGCQTCDCEDEMRKMREVGERLNINPVRSAEVR